MSTKLFTSIPHISRRDLLLAGATGATLTSLSACTAPSSDAVNLSLAHGATGGGLKDTLDAHFPVTWPDISRVRQLYEPLLRFDSDYKIESSLAESVEPNDDGTEWTVRLRDGILFHDGRKVTSRDVEASMARMFDPDNPAPYGADIAPIADLASSKVMDDRTYRLVLKEPYAIMDQLLANYTMTIVPADYDPEKPIGTGPFMAAEFTPGQRSLFKRFDDYWDQKAAYEELVIIDFADDDAKVNALLAGQIQTVDNLPTALVDSVKDQGINIMISETGGWVPFTMRVDAAPFDDNRVRQAMRLICDRQQMIDQAFNGMGRVANDLYAPFDPDYLGDELPQRQQDIDQAKALLKEAGQEGLQVELVTSTAVGAGAVEAANLFAEQAKLAGVDVRLNKVDGSVFYGEDYLSWVFAQDFWSTRLYLPQAAACALETSPYNETHWYDESYADLVLTARREVDKQKRRTLIQDAQKMEYEQGGYIIWAFQNQVDAIASSVTGLEPSKEQPLSSFRFNRAKPANA